MELVSFLAQTATNTTPCVGVDIPNGVYNLVHLVIMIIQIVVPILLIIWGMIDFVKAITSGDDSKIKNGQKTFIQRLIAAVFVFLIVVIVKLIFSVVDSLGAMEGGASADDLWSCVQNFLGGV